MSRSFHSKFIRTPFIKILEDGVNACHGIGIGIETYPLYDYIMQSIFMKMTGAQEQKLKCICWEMATYDYGYRHHYIDNAKNDYGEFSRYDHKNKVYSQLLEEIKKCDLSFNFEQFQWIESLEDSVKNEFFEESIDVRFEKEKKKQSKKKTLSEDDLLKLRIHLREDCFENFQMTISEPVKKKFINDIKFRIIKILDNTVLTYGTSQEYALFRNDQEFINSSFYGLCDNLLSGNLKNIYENDVIKHRHRCAHNLLSYQNNLPTLNILADEEYKYHNYFYRFFILILIDEIFIRLYDEYMDKLELRISNM